MIFSIVEEVFHGYDDECLLQFLLLVDDIDSSALDVDDDEENNFFDRKLFIITTMTKMYPNNT